MTRRASDDPILPFDQYRWRIGRKLGFTLYAILGGDPDHDVYLGSMDTREMAEYVVSIHNDRVIQNVAYRMRRQQAGSESEAIAEPELPAGFHKVVYGIERRKTDFVIRWGACNCDFGQDHNEIGGFVDLPERLYLWVEVK